MSAGNGKASSGVIRIGRKGLKKFAFGEEGTPGSEPFTVDVVTAFERWLAIDDSLRPEEPDESGDRIISRAELPNHRNAAVEFVESLRPDGPKHLPGYEKVTPAEALDFNARLREQYEELAVFFRPNLSKEQDAPATSGVGHEVRFSEEGQTTEQS